MSQVTPWDDIAALVESQVKLNVPGIKTTVIADISEYLNGRVGQQANLDYLILISRPQGEHYLTEPKLSGYFRRFYNFQIVLVVKTDPTGIGRITGQGKLGLAELQARVESALEHSNLGGEVDNKAGQNFEGGWEIIPTDNRAFSASTTIYTVVKTER